MMQKLAVALFFSVLLMQCVVAGESALQTSIRARSTAALLDETIAVEQAAVQARMPSSGGIELRTGWSENDGSLALRIYLPSQWTQKKLREQLRLAATSETLRVDELEWQELMSVYRAFCTYRMLLKQRSLYDNELNLLQPYLAQADSAVQAHQLAVADRARMYSHYLDLLTDRERIATQLLSTQQQLQLALGNQINLNATAPTAVITLPPRMDVDVLHQQALEHRSDFRQLNTDVQSLEAAEALARSSDGFRLKYLQPEYKQDLTGSGDNSWMISAAFTLPWGNRNPDVAVYHQQQTLTRSTMERQRLLVRERLQILLNTFDAYTQQLERRNEAIQTLLSQLKADVKQMAAGPLSQVRDWMNIRKQLLDTALQSVTADCERERIAVELVAELGTPELLASP